MQFRSISTFDSVALFSIGFSTCSFKSLGVIIETVDNQQVVAAMAIHGNNYGDKVKRSKI